MVFPFLHSKFYHTLLIYINEKTDVQKNIIDFAIYVLLFPQLIAGPIVRYTDIQKEIVKRNYDLPSVKLGLKRFIIGLGKK